MKESKRQHIIGRYMFLVVVFLIFVTCIIYKLVDTTIVRADAWNKKANLELAKMDTIYPKRGDILACDGTVLATNLNYYTLFIDFRSERFKEGDFMVSIDSLCDSLAVHFPKRDRKAWKDYLTMPLKIKKEKRPRAYLLVKDVPYCDYELVRTFPFFKIKNPNKTGLTVDSRIKRCNPYGQMARRSIGIVGETKECKQIHGRSGLEYALDSLLYGQTGLSHKVAVTNGIVNWTYTPPVHGYTIKTTIDINMQEIVENELNDMLSSIEAEWGTAILMHVPTGDIKAIANLERDTISGRYIEAMNRALHGYEPGSVVKTISMIVALEDGLVPNVNQTYSIGHSYAYQGTSPIKDTHSPATLTVNQFLEYSSNIGMTKLIAPHFESNPNGLRDRLRDMGFFEKFNTGIAGETTPYYPKLQNNRGGRISMSRMIYGYSTMIPPLYMCAMYNAIANDGRFVRPRIVNEVLSTDGTVDSVLPVTYVRDRICSVEHARTIRDMLYRVVYEKGGTAKRLRNDNVTIIGKTGTAKIAIERPKESKDTLKPGEKPVPFKGGYLEGRYRLAFCGIFPYESPQYTCMVLISKPKPGVRSAEMTSGFVVRNIAMKMFARGMLNNHSDYHLESNPGTHPTLYATASEERVEKVKKDLKIGTISHFNQPSNTAEGTVPSVVGLGAREAIVKLEKAGYKVAFKGVGYVTTQSITAGSRAPKGSIVKLNLTEF